MECRNRPPIALPDYYIYGDIRLSSSQQTLDQWFNTSKDIWVQRPPDTLRTAKLRSPKPAPEHSAAVQQRVDPHVFELGAAALPAQGVGVQYCQHADF
jgi:hypothetical protein